jgi:phage-related protein
MTNKLPLNNQEQLEILAGSMQGIRDSLDEIISVIDDAFEDIKEVAGEDIDIEEKVEILLEAINSTREELSGLISYADDVCIDVDPR